MSEDPVLDKVVEDFKARQVHPGQYGYAREFPADRVAPRVATKGSSYALVVFFLLLAAGVFLFAFFSGFDGGGPIVFCVGLAPLMVALLLWRGIRKEKLEQS